MNHPYYIIYTLQLMSAFMFGGSFDIASDIALFLLFLFFNSSLLYNSDAVKYSLTHHYNSNLNSFHTSQGNCLHCKRIISFIVHNRC